MSKQLTTKDILDFTEAQKAGDKPGKGEDKTIISLALGKPKRSHAKLIPLRRKQFLQEYYKTGNMAASALKVGVVRNSIVDLMKRDEDFNAAVKYVEDLQTDKLEEVSLQLASSPSRDGFPDRKLQLTSRRPEKYNPKQEIDIKHTVTDDTYLPEIRRILSQYVSSRDGAVEAKYTKCNDNNELEER